VSILCQQAILVAGLLLWQRNAFVPHEICLLAAHLLAHAYYLWYSSKWVEYRESISSDACLLWMNVLTELQTPHSFDYCVWQSSWIGTIIPLSCLYGKTPLKQMHLDKICID
jgi:hypothetical protein